MRLTHPKIFTNVASAILAILAVICAPIWAQEGNTSASAYYEDAVKRFNEEKYEETIIQLKNALQLEPEYLPATVLLGKAFLRSAKPSAAEEALTEAMERGADPSALLVPLHRSYIAQLKYEAVLDNEIPEGLARPIILELLTIKARAAMALSEFAILNETMLRLESLDSDHDDFLALKASNAIRQGNLAKAKQLTERLIRLYPNNEIGWLTRASLQHAEGNLVAALEDYQTLLELNPNNSSARLAKVGILFDLSRHGETADDLELLIKNDSEDPRTLYLRSIKFAHDGDEYASKNELNKTIDNLNALDEKVVSRNEQLSLIAGMSHLNLGNTESARDYLENYASIGGLDPQAHIKLAQLYIDDKQFLGAIKVMEGLAERMPMTIGMLTLQARAYHGANMHEKAILLLERAASFQNSPQIIDTQLALSKLRGGEIDDALERLELIFKNSQSTDPSGLQLAITYLNRGDHTQALRVALGLHNSQPDNLTYTNLLATAYVAISDIAKARELYQSILARYPNHSPARINLIKLDALAGNTEEARDQLLELHQSDSANALIMLEIARTYELEGDIKSALRWNRDAAEANLDLYSAQKNLIELLLRDGQTEEAEKFALDLENRLPKKVEILYLQVAILQQKKDVAGLKSLLRRMTKSAGSNTDWLAKIAELQVNAGAADEASYTLFKALQVNPESKELNAKAVDVLLLEGRVEEAVEKSEHIIKTYPGDESGYRVLGDTQMQQAKFYEALASYEQAFSRLESTSNVIRLFYAQRSANKFKLAETTLVDWLKQHPRDISVMLALAEFYLFRGAFDLAIDNYSKLLEIRPNDSLVHNNIANSYMLKGDLETALIHARRAQSIDSQAAYNDTLGWLLVQKGDYSEGLKYIREALARNASNLEYRYHLAEALYGLGRVGESRRELLIILESNVDFNGRPQAERLLTSINDEG